MKKKKPEINVRIAMSPTGSMRLYDPKRQEYHTLHRMVMYFDTREESHWNDLVVLSDTKLYKRLLKLKKFPKRMVFLATNLDTGEKFPISIGRDGGIRESAHVSYSLWPQSKIISITWVKISPLDMIEVLDKN